MKNQRKKQGEQEVLKQVRSLLLFGVMFCFLSIFAIKLKKSAMVTIANAIYDSVFKYLIDDEKIAAILIGSILNENVAVKQCKGREKTYTNTNNNRIYYSEFEVVILDGEHKLEKLYYELYRSVHPDGKVRFLMEFIGFGGHYKGFIDVKSKQEAKTHNEKILTLFGGDFNNLALQIEIDEFYDDSENFKIVLEVLKRAVSDGTFCKQD